MANRKKSLVFVCLNYITTSILSHLRKLLPRTDRILWKGNGIEQLSYRSHPQLQISDHKPVTSLLRSGVKVVDRDKERRVYEEIMKQLDKQENEYLPQVMVDTNEITFAEGVRFMEGQVWTLTQFFFLFPFCENSLICLEGKSMTPHRGNTILFRSSQQLPRLRLGSSKGFLS